MKGGRGGGRPFLRVLSVLSISFMAMVGTLGELLAAEATVAMGPPPVVVGQAPQVGVVGGPVIVAVSGASVQVSAGPWWIGVQCRPADPVLRAQLGLAENVGLVVDEVAPKSPAEKAGLKRFDVLVKAEDKDLTSVQDLIEVINRAEGKEIKLKYVRQAQVAEVAVTPEKRPATAPGVLVPAPPLPRWEWPHIELFGPPGEPFRFRFFYPGRIVPPKAGPLPPLPGNLAVTITKKGDEPAKISVKRDGESWEVTENELDKLPADIRPHVEQLLRGTPVITPPAEDGKAKERRDLRGWQFYWSVPPGWDPAEERKLRERIESELKELHRRMEELRERIEEMWKRTPGRQPAARPGGQAKEKPQGEQT
ncbi:MAG: PDZ domain-containing protein [Thermoguttaceae bacterium]|nr:PDZ domain-containing protein [Thermoguttaceae bacterium]